MAGVTISHRAVAVLAIIIGVAIVGPDYLRAYVITGDSDAPAYVTGDRVLVNRAAYDLRFPYSSARLLRLAEPKAGDVALLLLPDGTTAIKRVVAGPGLRVTMKGHHLVIDGRELDYRVVADSERFLVQRGRVGSVLEVERGNGPDVVVSHTPGSEALEDREGQEVPAGTFFVLGSNRDVSVDSRTIGCIPRERVLGKVIARVWLAGR